jgi:hypothetical protein
MIGEYDLYGVFVPAFRLSSWSLEERREDMALVQEYLVGDTRVCVSGEGYPLVFIHGFTTTSEFWTNQNEDSQRTNR